MSFTNTFVGNVTAPVAAADDLSGQQNKPVQIYAAGVLLHAGTASLDTRPAVLGNKPSSGGQCELINVPNVAKALCTGSAVVGRYVTCVASGMGLSMTSVDNINKMGWAHENANSGDLFAVQLV